MIWFDHLPKTGGTQVIKVLVAALRAAGRPYASEVVAWSAEEHEVAKRLGPEGPAIGVLSSHWYCTPVRFAIQARPGDRLITWRRDPVAMCFSAYRYYRQRGQAAPLVQQTRNPRLRAQGQAILEARDLEHYLDMIEAGVAPYPVGVRDTALRHREAVYDFIGYAEHMARDLRRLLTELGLPIDEAALEEVGNRSTGEIPTPDQWARVERVLRAWEPGMFEKKNSAPTDYSMNLSQRRKGAKEER